MRYSILFLILSLCGTTFAQSDSTSTGAVVDAEIIIEKDKKITLPQAEKISTQVEIKNFNLDRLQLSYEISEPDFNFPDYKSDIKFIEQKKTFPVAKFQNYVKAGFGNLKSPLLEAGLYHKLGKLRVGAKIFHESFGVGPIGQTNSAASNNLFAISANYKTGSVSITPKLSYQRKGYRFYGNTNRLNTAFSTDKPAVAFAGDFKFGFNLNGGQEELHYFINPHVLAVSQSLQDGADVNKEAGIAIDGGLKFRIDKKLSAGVRLDGFSTKYVGGVSYNRSLVKIRPEISRTSDQLILKAGFTLTSGKTDKLSQAGFYPFIDGSIKLSPKWSLYAGFDGGVNWNSLRDLLAQNLFLDDSLTILNTNIISAIKAGIKGGPTANTRLQAGVLHENLENLALFVPSESDSTQYTVTYDGGTISRFTALTELSISINSHTVLGAKAEFYHYSLDNFERAWHLPDYKMSLSLSQNIKNKLIIRANLVALGGLDSPATTVAGTTQLDAFLDLNLTATYRVTERISVFTQFNNLLGNQYERYLGYPVRGATFKLGGSYRF